MRAWCTRSPSAQLSFHCHSLLLRHCLPEGAAAAELRVLQCACCYCCCVYIVGVIGNPFVDRFGGNCILVDIGFVLDCILGKLLRDYLRDWDSLCMPWRLMGRMFHSISRSICNGVRCGNVGVVRQRILAKLISVDLVGVLGRGLRGISHGICKRTSGIGQTTWAF